MFFLHSLSAVPFARYSAILSLFIAFAICVVGVGENAQAQIVYSGLPDEASTPPGTRIFGGLRLGYGSAQTGAPKDEEPEDSLLFGSAFTGGQLRFAAALTVRFNDSLGLRTELGITNGKLSGFAENDDFRRDLEFNITALEVPVLLQAGPQLGRVHLFGHAGLVFRSSLSVAGRDVRTGDVPDSPPVIQVRTSPAFGLALGAGASIQASERISVPIEVRYQRALNYPNATADRFSDLTDNGRYWIEPSWTFVFSTGVDLQFGGNNQGTRAPREPRQARQPRPPRQPRNRGQASVPIPPPPVSPYQTPLPVVAPVADQDGDGVSDALDACPIEPSDPRLGSSTAGCPEGGGIVTLSCDFVALSMPIEFYAGSWELDPASYPVLYLVADTLNIAQNVRLVSIEGHTDDSGDATQNQMLSEDRAYVVMDFLIESGVDLNRLQATGFGEDYPIAENNTEAGRAANRRVEFRILSNDTCGF